MNAIRRIAKGLVRQAREREEGPPIQFAAPAPDYGTASDVVNAYAAGGMKAHGPFLTVGRWVAVMRKSLEAHHAAADHPDIPLDYTYNDFDLDNVAAILRGFRGVRVAPAREYSVAMYVKADPEMLAQIKARQDDLMAEEVGDVTDGSVRIWWD